MKSNSYFDADGNYGSADAGNLTILDTTTWTSAMWDAISDCGDNSRMDLAEHFDRGDHSMVSEGSELVCEECELRNQDLPVVNPPEPDVIY